MPSIDIKIPEGLLGGDYANMMQVTHTPEEFILDFMSAFPPGGELVSRLIVSPRHMKRIVRALLDNVDRYEQAYGLIQEASEPRLVAGQEEREAE